MAQAFYPHRAWYNTTYSENIKSKNYSTLSFHIVLLENKRSIQIGSLLSCTNKVKRNRLDRHRQQFQVTAFLSMYDIHIIIIASSIWIDFCGTLAIIYCERHIITS